MRIRLTVPKFRVHFPHAHPVDSYHNVFMIGRENHIEYVCTKCAKVAFSYDEAVLMAHLLCDGMSQAAAAAMGEPDEGS